MTADPTTPSTLDPDVVDAVEVYLCGPIGAAGNDLDPFRKAAAILRKQGFTVFNPADKGVDVGWTEIMRYDLATLMSTTKALVVLPGWDRGVGSQVEVMVALSIGLPVHTFDEERGIGPVLFAADAGRPAVADMLGTSTTADTASHAAAAGSPDENLGERPHEEAARIVLGPRGAFYDHPFDNFARTGLIWTGILYSKLREGEIVSPEDVALCMTGVKLARETFRHKRDNLVDGHGYLLTHEMVLEERARREGTPEA